MAADDPRDATAVELDGSYRGAQRRANRAMGDFYVPGTDGDVKGWSRTDPTVGESDAWEHVPPMQRWESG